MNLAASAHFLAWSSASVPQHSGKGHFLSYNSCSVGVLSLSDQMNVAGNIYVSWASELAGNQAFFSFASFEFFVHQGACWADFNAGSAEFAV
jgi:hypothetical protein